MMMPPFLPSNQHSVVSSVLRTGEAAEIPGCAGACEVLGVVRWGGGVGLSTLPIGKQPPLHSSPSLSHVRTAQMKSPEGPPLLTRNGRAGEGTKFHQESGKRKMRIGSA